MKLIIYYLFILFIFTTTFIFVNGQLTPVTNPLLKLTFEDSPNNIYSAYPEYSDSTECFYSLNYFVEDSSVNAGPLSNSLTINAPQIVNYYLILNDGPKSLFNVNGTIVQGSSIIVNMIASTLSQSETVEYSFNFTCITPDYSDISIVAFNKPLYVNSGSGYFQFLTVLGLKHQLGYVSYNDGFAAKCKKNNTQSFFWDNNYVKSNAFNPIWVISCHFGTTTLKINISNPFYGKKITLDQFDSYPSPSSSLVTEFGYGQSPIFKFHSDAIDVDNTYQYLSEDKGSIGYAFLIPVPYRGNKGNITYILNYGDQNTNGIDIFEESLIYINGSGLGLFSIPVNIKAFPKLDPPIPNLSMYTPVDPKITIVSAQFTDTFANSRVNFGIYVFNFGMLEIRKPFPFGFLNNTVNGPDYLVKHKVSFPDSKQSNLESKSFFVYPLSCDPRLAIKFPIPLNTNNNITPPKITSFEYIQLNGQIYILRVNISSVSGLERFFGPCVKTTIGESLISGNIFNGQYEFIVDILDIILFELYDSVDNTITYNDGDYISLIPLIQFKSPEYSIYKDGDTISNITFINNDIDVQNQSNYNIMYFNANEFGPNKSMFLDIGDQFQRYSNWDYKFQTWPIYWNEEMKMFSCKFIIPRGQLPGNLRYHITTKSKQSIDLIVSSQFSPDYQLRIANTFVDNSGPIFKNIKKIPNDNYQITSTTTFESIGWRLTIIDNIYGFNYGYIKVIGSFDNSIYTFNFTVNDKLVSTDVPGTPFEFTYDLIINLTSPCVPQDFVITNVYLLNLGGKYSTFELYPLETPLPYLNPFINYLNDSNVNKFTYTCATLIFDNIPPTLESFKAYINDEVIAISESGGLNTIDVCSSNRSITFKFSSFATTGFKSLQLPIVYIISKRLEILECHSIFVEQSIDMVSRFNCTIELPIGFGYPNPLFFSVYGLMNKAGIWSGYPTEDLLNIRGSPSWFVNTNVTHNIPIIKSNEMVLSEGGSILIYGKSFDKVENAFIKYLDDGSSTKPNFQPINITSKYSTAIILNGILSTSNPYIIKFVTFNSIESNHHIVYPIEYITPQFVTPTPSDTSIPSDTPSPTIAPTCKSNSDCGGTNHGSCVDGDCVCNSPWIGLKCTSKVIIVPQPSINTTNPTTEIPIGGGNGDDSTEQIDQVFYKSLISIVSLRELDFKGTTQIKSYTFDKWIYNEINKNVSEYSTNITSTDSNGTNSITTNITVTIEWFKDETIIEFANSSLKMNPSSVKYTIQIGKYLFSSELNQLQLVISALFESSSKDQCSSEQFSDTDKSNYIKIQIDNHSLYGRFIKRAIIDSKIKYVSNVLLNSQLDEISIDGSNYINTQSSVQSLIGITIPNYKSSIIIDPDFSVLLDSNSVTSNDENSICNKKSKSLSSAQLAGIIIGSVAFVAVVGIAITYHVLKKKKDRKFFAGVQNKMKQLNN